MHSPKSQTELFGLERAEDFRVSGRSRVALPRSEEEELRRLAEGRAEVVEILRARSTADLDAVRSAWHGDAPAGDELGEWLASLVADGTLTAASGPAGRPEYALAPPRPAEPRVVVDPEALARAVARREAAERDEADDPATR